MAENLARVEAAWNEEDAESKTSDEENDCHCDVARHAHLFVDGCHALCATELALNDERCGVFGLHDCKNCQFWKVNYLARLDLLSTYLEIYFINYKH